MKRKLKGNEQAQGLQNPQLGEAPQKPDKADIRVFRKLIAAAIGLKAPHAAQRLISEMTAMQSTGKDSPGDERFFGAVEMMAQLAPRNVTEAFLACQMFGVHEAAVLFLKRATLETGIEAANASVACAARLLRVFNDQLEAMQKLQGKASQQKVTVEHVHVHEGGQAIVGAVSTTKGEGDGGQ